MSRHTWKIAFIVLFTVSLAASGPSRVFGQAGDGGGSLNAAPGGPPGTTLGAENPDAIPATGPAPTGGEVSTPQGSDQSILPGGAGEEFPTSRGANFPDTGSPGLGQDGKGTGTGSTRGGSGTGTGGLSVGEPG